MTMNDLKVYRISFMNGTIYSNSIVLASTYEEAEGKLKQDYMDYDLDIEIGEYEEMNEKGVILTNHYETKND
ncbi:MULTISPECIES: hypothetical protein [unclassified Lysinibacillus]|uniref:hypothetical protein n=1 Tax=unclassified Lysinibacillus TaxID=2636778 RepID=UPI0020136675|nr:MULTISPECIES: hypothetical protein [unclassified Lysinibacillus]MCL1696403.1 hypothetical protein [Lysinibacillus sp. BPa_S21]MCL1700710.1 hypothetical protein [Lysinibacillus sp. Bpr_S20]